MSFFCEQSLGGKDRNYRVSSRLRQRKEGKMMAFVGRGTLHRTRTHLTWERNPAGNGRCDYGLRNKGARGVNRAEAYVSNVAKNDGAVRRVFCLKREDIPFWE